MEKYDDSRQLSPAPAASVADTAAARERRLSRWLNLAALLAPLVGERGFCALYGRTARVLIARYPWLTASQSCTSTTELFETLRADFAAVDSDTADAANAALMTTFTELLTALIGQALTNRLLTASNDDVGHKQAQEHNE